MNPAHLAELLSAARSMALAAGEITLRHYGAMLAYRDKADGTPVTVADREAEVAIRTMIGSRYPTHGVLGEELGDRNPGAAIRWIVDPIDGTLSFMRGVPLYAVLIGIEVEGDAVVGVAHFPALGETLAAARGQGCTFNGTPCRVSDTASLSEAVVCTTDEKARVDGPYQAGWQTLRGCARMSRTWGDAYGHALVATGRADVQVDPILNPWDAAPLLPIITEAGGRFTTVEGIASIHGGSGISSNGILHDEALNALGRAGLDQDRTRT